MSSTTTAAVTGSVMPTFGGGFASVKMFMDDGNTTTPVAMVTIGALLARAARGATFGDAMTVLTPSLAALQALVRAVARAVADNVVLPPRLLALLLGIDGGDAFKCVTMHATVWSDGKVTNVDLCERASALVERLAARSDLPLHLMHVGNHQAPDMIQMRSSMDPPRAFLPPCRLIAGDLAWRSIDEDVLFRCRKLFESSNVTRYAYDIASRKRSAADLQAWIDRITVDARPDAVASGVTGNRYHFVYRGHAPQSRSPYQQLMPPGRQQMIEPTFTKSVLAGGGVRCFDSLAHMHHPHVARLRRDMALLDDDAHFARHGGRRKQGYLFSGPPGTGKTASVAALAADTGRHILEVAWSRIQTNADLEDLMSLRCIDGVHFQPRQLLVFFDEIDGGGELFEKAAEKAAAAPVTVIMMPAAGKAGGGGGGDFGGVGNNQSADKLHVGAVLACLDGVANHDGLVIVAATNHPEKLPAGMKRSGRLTHIAFDYLRPEDAVAMARDFFGALTEAEARELADAVGKKQRLTGATLRGLCDRSDDVGGLIAAMMLEEEEEL